MAAIEYEAWNPKGEALAIIHQANAICAEYRTQGYDLTLRQLYYQFVARGLIPNTDKSYKRLGSYINKARMAGLLDWNYIVDRTRNLRGNSHWDNPGSVLNSAAYSFRLEKWKTQPVRVEVWVEKEALAGVISRVANQLDVDWFSCRGYVSQSEIWGAGQRLGSYIADGQRVIVLHLGDHDPSGIDMTRDIRERLELFIVTDHRGYPLEEGVDGIEMEVQAELEAMADDMGLAPWDGDPGVFEVRRIALNMDQVRQYNPPPNPAKITDSRATGYIAEFGRESWELDALDPSVLSDLITEHVLGERDVAAWEAISNEEDDHRTLLRTLSTRWADVRDMLNQEDS